MDVANTSIGSGMDVDEAPPRQPSEFDAPPPEESEDSDDESDDDPSDVAMVPMADMLNARYGSENVGIHFTLTKRPFSYTLFRKGKIIPRTAFAENGDYETHKKGRADSAPSFLIEIFISNSPNAVEHVRGPAKY